MDEHPDRQYYLVLFRTLQGDRHAIWYSDDIDGFVLGTDGLIRSFPTREGALALARAEGFSLPEAVDTYSITPAILKRMSTRKIDCRFYLDHWNIFSDAAHSIGCPFIGDDREKWVVQHTYEKLFYGCNLLVKENEEHYRPSWDKKERRWIAKVMKEGIKIVSKGLGIPS